MKIYLSFLLPISLFFSQGYGQNKILIHDDQAKEIISPNIYGHFAEHLGHCIYGGFYVGDSNREIPNTNGVRNDIIAALKRLKVPVLRWPGGCFADTYHWKNGIGPKQSRPSMVNTWWGGVTEDNSFGTHDFLNMCELIGAQPYLTGNVGSGSAQELADWVQYVNFSGRGPMSDLRRTNGREKPWSVRFWGVGNEAWGCGGNMRAEYYVDEFRKYATFMSSWGNPGGLVRIASGASDADYQWTETLMKNIPLDLLGGVALHHYSLIDWDHKGSATDFTEKQYFLVMKSALLMDSLIRGHAAVMDRYDPQKKVAMVVDEWGGWYDVEQGTKPGFLFQQNTMRDAMIAGITLNIFNNHCDRVRMANLAQTVNVLQAVILTDKEKLILTPTYYVMEMYNVHQGATLLPVTLISSDYVLDKEKLPAVSASVSRDKNGLVHISLVNIDIHHVLPVSIDLGNIKVAGYTGRILVSPNMQDYNSFAEPDKIKPEVFTDASLAGKFLIIKLPPASVVVLELK
jgi:alpha-L-arabinofuranosidase